MTYLAVESGKCIQIQSGDVLHCTSNGILGKLIRKFTKSNLNHSALAIEIWGQLYVVDSQAKGTNPIQFNEWLLKYNYTYKVHRPTKFTKEQCIKAASKWGHTPYDIMSLVIYQPYYLLTGKWKGHTNEHAVDKMYCSEYVSWVFDLPKWWTLSPQAVFDTLQSMPDKFTLIA